MEVELDLVHLESQLHRPVLENYNDMDRRRYLTETAPMYRSYPT